MYKRKTIVIITMCIAILLMVIGYALFSKSLKISETGTNTEPYIIKTNS